jgi:hypothetical protein
MKPDAIAGAWEQRFRIEPLPRCLPRHGKRLSNGCPAHLAFTEDVSDILHRGTDRVEGTEGASQSGLVWPRRTRAELFVGRHCWH